MNFAEVRARLADVVVTNVTPFKADGSVDYDTAARHARFLADNGKEAMAQLGLCLATVRDPLQELDPDEKQLVTRILKEW